MTEAMDSRSSAFDLWFEDKEDCLKGSPDKQETQQDLLGALKPFEPPHTIEGALEEIITETEAERKMSVEQIDTESVPEKVLALRQKFPQIVI